MTVKIPDSLPWRLDRKGGTDILSHNGDTVGETHGGMYQQADAAVEAAYIVHAANAYPALVEALRIISGHTNADDPASYRSDDREGCLDDVHSRAASALKAAGVEP